MMEKPFKFCARTDRQRRIYCPMPRNGIASVKQLNKEKRDLGDKETELIAC